MSLQFLVVGHDNADEIDGDDLIENCDEDLGGAHWRNPGHETRNKNDERGAEVDNRDDEPRQDPAGIVLHRLHKHF